MYRQITCFRIASINVLLTALLFFLNDRFLVFLTYISICLINALILSLVLHNLPKFLKGNQGRLFIGRKRTLIVLMSSVYISIVLFSIYYKLTPQNLLALYLFGTIAISIVYFFADAISGFLHKIVKKNRRIVILGYDDNANKLAQKLKKKNNGHFIGHLQHDSVISNTNADTLSHYIDFAKKNRVKELYLSVPEQEDAAVSVLAEEAEKHCIRVNLIAPQQNFGSGFYHTYIGGLPVLLRYREPLRRLHRQALKRTFDIFVSSMVIIFILSWLIPLVSILIKLESKGPVFFKQLRSGRENDSFTCLKFRSMRVNEACDKIQATKNDERITKVGTFLRKTSLDEFPQFLNVFMGDMSIVGPRPHMLRHTKEYSEQISNYMVRLYLKPGLTGWAQVNGYRGEIKNIELLKQRVEHDIWYMENWSTLLDIKIMYLTLINILKGEENAY